MLTSSVIVDIVIFAIVALSLLMGARRGLFRTLAELISTIAAYVIASLLTGGLAAAAAEWLRPIAEERLSALVSEYLSGALEKAPAFLTAGVLEEFLERAVPEAIVEQGLYNIAYALVFVAVFLLALIALRILIRMVDTVLKLPLLHEVNTLGGAAAGALKGAVLVGLLIWLARRTGLLVSPEALAGSLLAPLWLRFLPA